MGAVEGKGKKKQRKEEKEKRFNLPQGKKKGGERRRQPEKKKKGERKYHCLLRKSYFGKKRGLPSPMGRDRFFFSGEKNGRGAPYPTGNLETLFRGGREKGGAFGRERGEGKYPLGHDAK